MIRFKGRMLSLFEVQDDTEPRQGEETASNYSIVGVTDKTAQ